MTAEQFKKIKDIGEAARKFEVEKIVKGQKMSKKQFELMISIGKEVNRFGIEAMVKGTGLPESIVTQSQEMFGQFIEIVHLQREIQL